MAKIRKLASIENGIMEALKILTEKEIQEAIGKGSSYLRKCSNPDLPQQLDHNDSIKLDIKCIQKGKGHPLYDSHEYIVINELENVETHKTNDIDILWGHNFQCRVRLAGHTICLGVCRILAVRNTKLISIPVAV